MSADQEIAYLRSTLGVTGGTLNDLRMQMYGGTGTQSERARAFWKTGGGTGNSLEELERTYLKLKSGRGEPVTLADLRQAWFSNPTPPGPKVIASETWTGADGAAWPAQWVPLANNGPSTIQGNQGALSASNVSYTPNRRAISGLAKQNVELYCEFTILAAAEAYIDFSVRQDLTKSGYYPDGYFISCDVGGTVWTLGGIDSANGQFNNVDTTIAWTVGVPYGMRLRAEPHPDGTASSLISGKVWRLSDGEPASWVKQIKDGTYLRAGSTALGYSSGNSTNPGIRFDNLQMIELS